MSLSRKGNYLGSQYGIGAGENVRRMKKQLKLSEDNGFSVAISKKFIYGKISHQLTLMHNFPKKGVQDMFKDVKYKLNHILLLLNDAKTSEQIMGYEGLAADIYFKILGKLVPDDLMFDKRSRRPPKDIFNAAISYGYAILQGECTSALRAAGLDPYIGFLHSDQTGRVSLSLDFMEEFRPYVVDQVVMNLVRHKAIKAKNGIKVSVKQNLTTQECDDAVLEVIEADGVWLDADAKKALTQAYERRLLTVTKGAIQGFSGSIRRHIYRQAQLLAKVIDNEDVRYLNPLSWR